MLDTLATEWAGGLRDFDALFGAFVDGELVGVGGLTPCPYDPRPGSGRVRRLYLAAAARGVGAGAALLAAIVEAGRGRYRRLTLRTDSPAAAAWYLRRGFAAGGGLPGVTHCRPYAP